MPESLLLIPFRLVNQPFGDCRASNGCQVVKHTRMVCSDDHKNSYFYIFKRVHLLRSWRVHVINNFHCRLKPDERLLNVQCEQSDGESTVPRSNHATVWWGKRMWNLLHSLYRKNTALRITVHTSEA
jgi:hypothetical protein